MSRTEKGSAGVEMIWSVMFILAFISIVWRFSVRLHNSHELSLSVQNEINSVLKSINYLPCMEDLGFNYVEMVQKRTKRIYFFTQPVCSYENTEMQ